MISVRSFARFTLTAGTKTKLQESKWLFWKILKTFKTAPKLYLTIHARDLFHLVCNLCLFVSESIGVR